MDHTSAACVWPLSQMHLRLKFSTIYDTPITFETELPSLEEFEGRIRAITAEYPWIVCEDETGRIIGYAYGHKQLERAAYRWNAELSEYLDSRVTSKGIGKRMLLVLLELLKAQGVHTVYSLVTSPNVKSDAMHNGCGFRTMSVCKIPAIRAENGTMLPGMRKRCCHMRTYRRR